MFAPDGSASETAIAQSVPEASADAGDNHAQCLIESGEERYEGLCLFNSDPDGSFFVRRADGRALFGEITDVSVTLTAPGEAEVRGLTTRGINSRWGPALRSQSDRACWVAQDSHFRVCAYG